MSLDNVVLRAATLDDLTEPVRDDIAGLVECAGGENLEGAHRLDGVLEDLPDGPGLSLRGHAARQHRHRQALEPALRACSGGEDWRLVHAD